jgi:hypothetical protein
LAFCHIMRVQFVTILQAQLIYKHRTSAGQTRRWVSAEESAGQTPGKCRESAGQTLGNRRASAGQAPGKRRASTKQAQGKRGKPPGKRWKSAGQALGKCRASNGQTQGKRRASAGQAMGKRRASNGQTQGKRKASAGQDISLVCLQDNRTTTCSKQINCRANAEKAQGKRYAGQTPGTRRARAGQAPGKIYQLCAFKITRPRHAPSKSFGEGNCRPIVAINSAFLNKVSFFV